MEGNTKRVDDTSREMLKMISLSKMVLTDEENDAILNLISHEELPAVHPEIRETAERIYNNWGNLKSIVQRHEVTIQKRWTNKSIMKRRELLLTAWPNMSRDHRHDLAVEMKAYQPTRSDQDGTTPTYDQRQGAPATTCIFKTRSPALHTPSDG